MLIYDLLGPRNLAATVRTGLRGGEFFDTGGSMAQVAAVEADASLVASMTPLLARFRSLFGEALQIPQRPFIPQSLHPSI